ncbi:carbon-nitrogen hydrolase [Mrakia frigida]|uniref:carbon-nitrogen hydrolase n=1 Tax=Mrakia frigida TaxID=29902 RepID=UPI003FCC0DB8
MVLKAVQGGEEGRADLVMLPEIFNSPTLSSAYGPNSEPIPTPTPSSSIAPSDLPSIDLAPTLHMLSSVAKEAGVRILGGSIPEREDGETKIWNTATVWDDQGNLVAKHRKIHLYDVDIPGGITFFESKSLAPGSNITVFETPFGTIATAICYDIRFPDLLSYMMKTNPNICAFLLPSAFNLVTGPRDWEILQRIRAIDNQIFVGMCSASRDETADYVSYGHTLVASPLGTIISSPTPSDQSECIVRTRIDPALMRQARESLPLWRSSRPDVYGEPGKGL